MFVESELTPDTYKHHLVCRDSHHSQKTKIDGSPWIDDWGLILPPINEKGEVSFGAIDVDVYTKPELFNKKRQEWIGTSKKWKIIKDNIRLEEKRKKFLIF